MNESCLTLAVFLVVGVTLLDAAAINGPCSLPGGSIMAGVNCVCDR